MLGSQKSLERQQGAGPWERFLVGQSTVAPIGDTVTFVAVAKCLTQTASRVMVLARLIWISISSALIPQGRRTPFSVVVGKPRKQSKSETGRGLKVCS